MLFWDPYPSNVGVKMHFFQPTPLVKFSQQLYFKVHFPLSTQFETRHILKPQLFALDNIGNNNYLAIKKGYDIYPHH